MIRQFVAMPLGAGYSAEEQITGAAEHGGLQIHAYPIKAKHYEPPRYARVRFTKTGMVLGQPAYVTSSDMGLAPGGRMRQEIYRDRRSVDVWNVDPGRRCFVHLANSLAWRAITGEDPPTTPFTARDYRRMHIPWFDYDAEGESALAGSGVLQRLKRVVMLGKEKGDVPLPENESVTPDRVVQLRRGLREGQVREGRF